MDKSYICDDRNVLEDIAKIRRMTDEEFEAFIKQLREKEEEEKKKS